MIKDGLSIEEKRREIIDHCKKTEECDSCKLNNSRMCCITTHLEAAPEIVDEAYNVLFPVKESPCIKDSGSRREFESGAVRDIQEGKGRCDLMPLDVVGEFLADTVLVCISRFQHTGDVCDLMDALSRYDEDEPYTLMLEVAKHFEDGARKYGEHNWQKGIPTHCYIDSAVRHYLKYLRGDEDEPHNRAFVWNILCCWWTCIHKPELNDYRKENGNANSDAV